MKIRKTRGEYPLDIVVLDETVHFDETGVADVDEIIGDVLLEIPGYEEYKEKLKKPATSTPDDPKGKKDTGKGKQDQSPTDQDQAAPPETKE
ncbi:hypothetical protein [Paenibacillus durus]|uniref:Uncharacterized protein n=1 Tax=Paenibacillus durus ATCC 35681 TaxID=1333534 RepID=A0A0F7FBE4_PAEDU|nr:hypothetical protein [Paenibacillus durus]AKG36093.1 hypothetical protein VK70_17285 [Paenibacillus durus ATCC 35681]